VATQTPAAPAVTFGVGANERPGGRGGGAHNAFEKRREGEKRDPTAMGQHHFKRAWRGVEEGGGRTVGGGHTIGGGGGRTQRGDGLLGVASSGQRPVGGA
jgi:hypothetical protein